MVLRLKVVLGAAAVLLAANSFSQTPGSGDTYQYGGARLTPLESRGRDTWYFWTAGGQHLWRKIAIITNGATDLVQYVDSRRNGHRFRDLGVITQPGCKPATGPDEYGLWFDDCVSENLTDIPGQASGILGLRKYPNPAFDRA